MKGSIIFLLILFIIIVIASVAFFIFNSKESIKINQDIDDKIMTSEELSRVCKEDWMCGDWSYCYQGSQTRECKDNNFCNTTINKPDEIQKCTEEIKCTESWSCSDWSICIQGIQSRTCTDSNACGTKFNKPLTTQPCYDCIESWECSDWSLCNALTLKQSRDCTDNNNCKTLNNKPELYKDCVCAGHYEKRCVSFRTMYWFDSCNRTEYETQETCEYTYKCENAECILMNCDEISGEKCLMSLCTGFYFNMADTTPPIMCCKGTCAV